MSAATSLPVDHAVRERALDPARSFIVEAPAGSGKTELLTRRFLRLLACVREPEEVLAITFTRKAAAEMRNRILRALALAESSTPDAESQRPIWQLARAVRDADARHDWQLRSHPARLRIMTIDALNSFLAKQLPLLSGIGATLRVATDPETLYADTVRRLIERLSDRDAASDVIARLLRHLDNRYEIFESLISRELRRREHWLDLGLLRFDPMELREQLEAALEAAVVKALETVHARVPVESHQELIFLASHAAAVLNGMGAESEITACDDLTGLPRAECEALRHWKGLAALMLTEKGSWRAKIDKSIGFPADNKPTKQRMIDLIERLRRETDLDAALHTVRSLPNARYTNAQWQVLTDLLAALKLAIAELEVVMRERGEGDYTANSIAARRALGTNDEPTDLALRLDYRLQHILVDEFQDTARGQIELLSLLTAGWTEGDGRTLFCVGDPMQSIYRFRNADVGLFLNLKRNGLQQILLEPLRLTVNFRSSQPILEWVNRAFAVALPQRDNPESGAVAFTPSEPRESAETTGGVFVHAIAGERVAARKAEAKQICDVIALARSTAPAATIAVLVGSRLHLQRVIAELRARRIAFNAVEIDPLVSRPAIQDVVALTRALVHLGDRTAWLAILRAPWCGLSLADLHELGANETEEPGESKTPVKASGRNRQTIWDVLNDPGRTQRISSDGRERLDRLLPTVRQALSKRGRMGLRDCVERAWVGLGGPGTLDSDSALKDCDAYFAHLEGIERNGDLEDVATLEEALRNLHAVDGETTDVRVELMTIHRAKGLEFDVVILPALDGGAKSDEAPLLRTQGSSQIGDRALLLAPIPERGDDDDATYGWLKRLEKERSRFEKGRLLYVAATRAVRELHLFGAVGTTAKPQANTFLSLLWPIVESAFNGAMNAPGLNTGPEPGDARILTRRLPLKWTLPKPADEFFDSGLRNVVDAEPLRPEFAWAGETARHIGTVVHREIERLARRGDLSMSDPPRDQGRYRTALAELGVPPQFRDAAVERIERALKAMVSDERGRWLLAGADVHRDVTSEFAITGKIGGDIVNRIIDRTFVDRDGTRWIVDFKTSTHEGAGIDEFLANEVVRYGPQLQSYSELLRGLYPYEPIKAALYFPLLGAWREVALDAAIS